VKQLNLRQNIKKDNRGMLLIEFTIYFPIVIVTFFAFLLVALMITQRVVLDRAVSSTTQSASNWISTSMHRVGSQDLFMGGEVSFGRGHSFFNRAANPFFPRDRAEVLDRIAYLVERNARLGIVGGLAGNVEVYVDYSNFFVAGNLTVSARQRVNFPINLSLIGINARYLEFHSSSNATVFRPMVTINQVYAIFDNARHFTRGGLDISRASNFFNNAPSRLNSIMSQIGIGFGNQGG